MSRAHVRLLILLAVPGLGFSILRPAAADPIAFVVAIKGKVEVIPVKASAPQRAALGRQLERGDKVQVGPASSTTLFFSDGNVIELAEKSTVTVTGRLAAKNKVGAGSNVSGEVFAEASKFLVGGSRQAGLTMLAPVRGSAGEQTPIIVSPRRTAILSDRPEFKWRAVEGATRYRVTLSDEKGEVWKREIQGTTSEYPTDAGALKPDADYLWEVQALSDRGPLRRDESMFHLVSSDEAAAVRERLSRIEESAGGASSPAVRFLEGTYLSGRGLYRDAAEHFEALCLLAPESPGPHEVLGKVYSAMGLTDLAAAELEKALTLSREH